MHYRSLSSRFLIAGALLLQVACSSDSQSKNHGPITLGDPATIVTETDSNALLDQVADLQPVSEEQPEEVMPARDTTTAPAKDTVAAKPAAPEAPVQKPAPAGNGLTMVFKEATVFIPNIVTRNYGRQDLKNARGATYELSSGNLAGNQLRITGATVQKVTQRYQTRIVLQDEKDQLPLESLGYSSDWQDLKGSNGNYNIAGLEPSRLGYSDARPAAIRNAVQQATRRQRLSRSDAQDWMDFARNIRAANQKPCVVVLSNVSWRITGKDAAGKTFNKEVRIDMPR